MRLHVLAECVYDGCFNTHLKNENADLPSFWRRKTSSTRCGEAVIFNSISASSVLIPQLLFSSTVIIFFTSPALSSTPIQKPTHIVILSSY
jgi:hypothetical protein